MAQKSGFFNAINTGGSYDRKYNANDYCDNLAVVISDGVLRTENDDLKVTATGLIPKVNPGRAWIKGHWYYNETELTLAAVVPPVGASRIDRVILRLDLSFQTRTIEIDYLQGTAANTPTPPALTRNDTIWEICLAEITISAGASSLSIIDKRNDSELCGWVYSTSGDNSFFTSLDSSFNDWFSNVKDTLSSVTLFKRYKWEQTLNSQASSVQFSIPQYDNDTCWLEVYVNGIYETRYTLNGSTISFPGTLTAGTKVTVNAYKSIDGTDIMSVADEITELQNAVATLDGVKKFTYVCTGTNDNISLSQIAQAFYAGSYDSSQVTTAADDFLTALGGNTFLAALTAEAQITVDVVGRAGVTTPFYGAGTLDSRYQWFSFGVAGSNPKKIIFDFAKCEKISIACSGVTSNIIFYGTDLNVKNANVYAYSNGAVSQITMIAGSANTGAMNFENCRFNISTTGDAIIAENGTFFNCWSSVASTQGNAICFNAKSASLVRVIAGTFFAYKGSSSNTAAIFNIDSVDSNAVVLAEALNCPTTNKTGFSQQYLAKAGAGQVVITGVCSTMTSSGSAVTITGQVWKSKQ